MPNQIAIIPCGTADLLTFAGPTNMENTLCHQGTEHKGALGE